jgi:hypothetical protein
LTPYAIFRTCYEKAREISEHDAPPVDYSRYLENAGRCQRKRNAALTCLAAAGFATHPGFLGPLEEVLADIQMQAVQILIYGGQNV